MEFIQPIITAIYFIFGGVLLFLAYSIIRDDMSSRLNRITGLMLFFAALGPIFLALGAIVEPTVSANAPFEESILYNLLYIWELFFPAFLLFSWVFPVDRLSQLKHPRLRLFIFIPHIFHLLLVIVFNNPEKILGLLDVESGEGFISLILEPLTFLLKWIVLGFTLLLSSETTLFATINIMYVVLAIYFIIKGRAQISDERIRNRSTVIIYGISIAMIIYTFGFLVPNIFAIELSWGLKTALLMATLFIGAGSIVWSIVTHQFLDVTVLVRQSLVYTISSAILVGMYILLVGQANVMLASIFGEKTTIINIAFIVLALILFQPINSRLDNLIDRFFIKRRTDYRNVMEELSRRLASVMDLSHVQSTIEKTLQSSILIGKMYFVLFDDKINEYVLQASDDYPDKVIVNRDDIFLCGVGQLNSPTMIDRLSMYSQGSDLYEEMHKRRVQLILPLKDANHMLGYLALTAKMSGFSYNAEDITMLGVIANQLVTVLTNVRLYLDSLEKQRLHEEMTMARQIQLDLLPKCPPRADTFEICACSMPSRTIGGDFYDFINKRDGRFGMVIADASGKGLPAALMVTQIQAMLRSEVGNHNSISQILGNINQYITDMTSSEKFATLFYGEFDPTANRFYYANAGHNYPILVRSDGSHEFLSKGGMLIGAFGSAQYEDGVVEMDKDDLIFFYTDGLSEAMNEKDEEYGEERIIDQVVKNRKLNTDELADAILNDKNSFDPTNPPQDDTTLVILKVLKGVNDGQNTPR